MSGNRVVAYYKDKAYGSFPNVSRDGYKLDYWKDSGTGQAVTTSTIADKTRTLVAVWAGGATPEPTTYKLTVSGGEGSGSYTVGAKIKLVPSANGTKDIRSLGSNRRNGFKGQRRILVHNDACIRRHGGRCVEGRLPVRRQLPSRSFADVPVTYWAHNDIDNVVASGMFKGLTETNFGVNVTMDRAMFVTVLYRLDGSPDVSEYENRFSDVSSTQYCYNAPLWGLAQQHL